MANSEVAFSYTRFSSAAQADGDSIRRQNALRDDWLKRHPAVKLDTSLSLVDSGVSGFRGKHRSDKRNALAQFLDLVKRGRVPSGAWLIVESVDRLSREHPEEALPFMYDIIRAGVRIVTLSPTEMVYQEGMDLGRTLMMLMETFRGHGESARKSDLCGQAWKEIKNRARESKEPMGKNLHPAWVKIENGKHVLIPGAADAVRTIYKLAANGWSTPKITRHLNELKVPAIGRKGEWVRSYVQKIIMDRSVLGEYQPTKGRHRREIDGEPICDYWPRVVSDALFERVRSGRVERSTHPDIRGRGRRAARIVHSFSGMLTDALDDCPMYTIKARSAPRCEPEGL
ncbi:recombinase family protein [Gemmata sp.]|uniref:recombinase family protein n=1 Tax=Gemmata sp. TaxID=1914242 RepID=UPI003F703B16